MTRAWFAVLAIGCGSPKPAEPVQNQQSTDVKPMERTDEMQAVRNDTIQFATFRPPGAMLPTRGRQVMVVAPPEAVALAHSGDLAVIDRLIALLGDPDRAWAAEVILAAMTGHDADLVNDFQPADFYATFGQGLKKRWQAWFDGVRTKLQWDESSHRFVIP